MAAFLTAVATVRIVRAEPELAITGDSAAALAADVAVGLLLVVAAVASWHRGAAFPGLLALAGIAWLVGDWNTPGAGPGFTAGLALYASWPVFVAAAALRGPDERGFGRAARLLLAVAFGTAVGVLGLASAVVFDPGAQGCSDCPRNLLNIADAPDLGHSLGQIGLGLTVVWASGFAVVGLLRLVTSSLARRLIAGPVLVPAAAAVALFALDAAHSFARGFISNDPTDRALHLGQTGALALTAGGVAITWLRTRRTRDRLTQLVLDIGAAPAPGELRDRLAESLGDPSLKLLFRLEPGEWIDGDGRRLSLPVEPARETTRVRVAGEEVLAVVHRRGLLDDPHLVRELTATAALALQHERLHAARRARLEDVRASCARIVAASDRERRTLERDLHDGAQQRLVALAIAMRLARRSGGDDGLEAGLAAAEVEVRAAVADLREVAHGLFPAVLADEGLRAALETLSEEAPRLVPRELPEGRFASAVESAVYFAAREALRSTDCDVTVDAVAEGGQLRVVIGGAALDGEMTQLRDRVGAVGGTVTSRAGDLLLELPCAS
ncbi:MAG TPA: histidine kinase [Thermoleophilaceae bacterium]|nr:histidine kinase [Thermoleophilaceae bacterium]